MQRKGQAELGAHFSGSGYDAQAAYAITTKVAVMANYSTISLNPKGQTDQAGNNSLNAHNFGEIGAGLYKRADSGWSKEIFFLAGVGKTTNQYTGIPPTVQFNSANYNRFMAQADFGKIKKRFEFAFSPALMVVYYYNLENYQGYSRGTNLMANAAITMRFKIFKFLKFSSQFNTTAKLIGSAGDYKETSPFNLSIGLIGYMNFFRKPAVK